MFGIFLISRSQEVFYDESVVDCTYPFVKLTKDDQMSLRESLHIVIIQNLYILLAKGSLS